MALYTIKSETLTALGDAVREKTGELTKPGYVDSYTMDIEFASNSANSRVFYQFPTGTRSAKIKKIFANQRTWIYLCDSNQNAVTEDYKYIQWMLFDSDEDIKENVIQDGYWVEFKHNDSGSYKGQFEITSYDADGNIIQVPGEVKNTMTPAEMAEAIEGLPPSPPEEAYTLTGDCGYRFAYGGWDWFINQYADKMTTKDVTSCGYMFNNSKVEEIPFDINLKQGSSVSLGNMFYNCRNLTKAPNKIIGKISSLNYLFRNCEILREVSDEFATETDGSYLAGLTSAYSGDTSHIFNGCYSLRKYPNSLLKLNNPTITNTYSTYNSLFNDCYALDEIVDLPVVHRSAKWTGSAFSSTFDDCYRLKRLTFETNEDGSPIKIDTWSKQTINLSTYVGYANSSYVKYITDYNSGITTAKRVSNDETYVALKDDKDWYTSVMDYSRYNKTSAVETINSLPDLSGGAGSNTIKFKGASGALTDGGAINTMTEEEIAVATAKGWTVSFA